MRRYRKGMFGMIVLFAFIFFLQGVVRHESSREIVRKPPPKMIVPSGLEENEVHDGLNKANIKEETDGAPAFIQPINTKKDNFKERPLLQPESKERANTASESVAEKAAEKPAPKHTTIKVSSSSAKVHEEEAQDVPKKDEGREAEQLKPAKTKGDLEEAVEKKIEKNEISHENEGQKISSQEEEKEAEQLKAAEARGEPEEAEKKKAELDAEKLRAAEARPEPEEAQDGDHARHLPQENIKKVIEESQPGAEDSSKELLLGGFRVCSTEDRLKNLRSKCDNDYPELKTPTSFFAHTKVDDRHKLIICVVPKAAGTSIHNMMHLTLTGNLAPDVNHCGESCWEDAGVWPLSHFSKEEREQRLRDYHKIMVVRNPFERLVSCWNDKFKNPGSSLHNRKHGFRLIERIRKVPTNIDIDKELPWSTPLGELMKKNYSEEVTRELKKPMFFKEFVQLIENYELNDPEYHDDHWKPIHTICQPCYVNYDYIVRVETLSRDARHILEKLQLDVDKFPHFNSNRDSTSHLTKELTIYDELPVRLKKLLAEYYKIDMDLLGYEFNSETNMASCNKYKYGDANEKCC